jgi:hypothetical protein
MFSASNPNPFQNMSISMKYSKTKYTPNENKIFYITVATKPHPVLDHLKKCVASNNETIHILGEAENRVIGWESHQNFGIKLREVCNFLKQPNLSDDDIILFTDAYDVVYLGNKTTILERFAEFEKPIVFGCEKYCFPDPNRKSEYLNRIQEFSFLNSGMFIGRVWALRKCISDYVFDDSDDDQRYWTTQYFEKPNLIELDYMNRLFLNMYDIDMSKLCIYKRERTVWYRNHDPMFIHINGPDKTEVTQYLI